MAEQIGIGTLLGSDFAVTGYADADGRRLIRVKSSLRKLKWKRAATMKNSREAARHFGAASSIAGGIWANVPGGLRRLMDSGAFNRLVSTCRLLQEWDGNLGDCDGFRNLELAEGALGPHRVVRTGSGWGVVGMEALWEEVDRVTVVCLNQNLQDSQDFQKLDQNLQDCLQRSKDSQDFQKLGGTGASGSDWVKRRKRIRRMAGVVAEDDFRHGPGRKWDRVEEVYGQEENPRVRFWEGRGMFDYGRVMPPRIELAQRFLRSPYVSCWPFDGNLGRLDCLNQNLQNSQDFQNSSGVSGRVLRNWESAVRPDRRYRVWVQACEIGRVREAGGRAGARFQLESVGGSPLGSGGFVSEWTVVRGERVSGLAGVFASVAGFDERGERRVESFLAGGLTAGFDERLRMKDERPAAGGLLGSPSARDTARGHGGFELVSHGGTGVFVVIAGIEVAEKRGRHWVRLPWCCKVRVVDVKQNSQNSQDLQSRKRSGSQTRLLPGSQDSLCVDQDSGNWELRSGCLEDVGMDGDGMVDLAAAGMVVEFKEGWAVVGPLVVRGLVAWLGNAVGIVDWVLGLGP